MAALGFELRARGRPGFDFSGGVLPAGAVLTRASAGTRVDAAGALVGEGADVARFDFDPVTLACRGVLIEPAATNVVLASRDLTAAAWSRSGVTTTATNVIETTASGAHYAAQSPAFAAGTAYCFSAIAKEAAGGAKRWLVLYLHANAFTSTLYAKFDLATGQVAFVSAGASAAIAPAPGGRMLCAVSATATTSVAAGSANTMVRLSDVSGGGFSYTGDGASGVEAGDCQIETGAVATSRIVTTAAAGSRAADVLTLDWAARGVADGAVTLRCGFDDGSEQDVSATVAGGVAALPAGLARARVRRVTVV